MKTFSHNIGAVLLFGVAVAALAGWYEYRRQTKLAMERKLRKTEKARWEDEGGPAAPAEA
jgi:hypothetical protein